MGMLGLAYCSVRRYRTDGISVRYMCITGVCAMWQVSIAQRGLTWDESSAAEHG